MSQNRQAEIDEKRLRYRRKLRTLIKLVLANLYWLAEPEEKLTDNVIKNVQLLTRRKTKKSGLTVTEKGILSKPGEERTAEEKAILQKVIGGLSCFKKYPDEVKADLASITYFMYFGPGRQIVKQDHEPNAMYFLISGEASISVKHFNENLNDWIVEDHGVMPAGSVFGELALLHGVGQVATITTTQESEMLVVKKEDFDRVLKSSVMKNWIEVEGIMGKLSYFKNWDIVTRRECSLVARRKFYAAGETLFGDKKGLPLMVYFIISGTCFILQHLRMRVHESKGIKRHSLCKDDVERYNAYDADRYPSTQTIGTEDSLELTHFSWEKDKTESYFIKVCDLAQGACFNIGEQFPNRRIIAKTPVSVFLVPREFIIKNNKDNLIQRVVQFMDKHIPDTNQIFKHFLNAMKFNTYRKRLIKDLLAEKKVPNTNSIHNVPYSIRLNAGKF